MSKEKEIKKISKYYIDYVYDNPSGANFYHQLVRRSDGAILYANPNLDNVYISSAGNAASEETK